MCDARYFVCRFGLLFRSLKHKLDELYYSQETRLHIRECEKHKFWGIFFLNELFGQRKGDGGFLWLPDMRFGRLIVFVVGFELKIETEMGGMAKRNAF